MRYEVASAKGETEGLLADEWEIHPSGALVFYSVDGYFKTFVIAFASGAWSTFYSDELE